MNDNDAAQESVNQPRYEELVNESTSLGELRGRMTKAVEKMRQAHQAADREAFREAMTELWSPDAAQRDLWQIIEPLNTLEADRDWRPAPELEMRPDGGFYGAEKYDKWCKGPESKQSASVDAYRELVSRLQDAALALSSEGRPARLFRRKDAGYLTSQRFPSDLAMAVEFGAEVEGRLDAEADILVEDGQRAGVPILTEPLLAGRE